MKKLLLVIGIVSYSIFGFSQNLLDIDILETRFCNSSHFFHSIRALTNDKKTIYSLSDQPGGIIYKIDPKSLTITGKIKFKLPEFKIRKGSIIDWKHPRHDPNELAYDGKNLLVAWAGMEKIYKINKYTGKIVGSIDGPSIENMCQDYGGIEFYNGYLWVIRNDWEGKDRLVPKPENPYARIYKHGPVLFKISKYGKVIDKWDLPGHYLLGLNIKNGMVQFNQMAGKQREGILTIIKLKDLMKKKEDLGIQEFKKEDLNVQEFKINIGSPVSITSIKNLFFFNTGAMSKKLVKGKFIFKKTNQIK